MTTSVLIAGSRTPIGKFRGALGALPATELGAQAIRGALERAGISGEDVDYVIMGQVLQAGCGQEPARQPAYAAGIPMTVPATTVNKVCLSGLDAIALADQLIRAGEYRTVVAGGHGVDDPGAAPAAPLAGRLHLRRCHSARPSGPRRPDRLVHRRLHGPAHREGEHRNAATGLAGGAGQLRGRVAPAGGPQPRMRRCSADEITPVRIAGRKGETVVDADEGVRADTSLAVLGKLRPSFSADGTITAGTASPISDGAAAVVVMDKELAIARGLTWIAEIGPSATTAGPDSSLQLQPAKAIAAACVKGRHHPRRPRPDRDQRGLRRSRAVRGARARSVRGRRQPRRWRHRAGPPDRGVRRAYRAAPGSGPGPPRRRHRRGRPLRWRRTGRGPAPHRSPPAEPPAPSPRRSTSTAHRKLLSTASPVTNSRS